MNVSDAIEARRAVKHFDPNSPMTVEEERRLLELAQLSPTAFNIQNWRFVVVKDKALRQKIREAAWGQAQVTDASLLVVVCGDLKAWDRNPERYWRNSPEAAAQLVPMIRQYYEGREQVQRDELMRSAGMAAQTIMLAAQEMGYDSCPMDGFDFDAVGKLINLPADHAIAMFVAVGKRTKDAYPRGGSIAYEEAVITDRFH